MYNYDTLILNSTLIRIGDYVNTNTRIKHWCKLCDKIIYRVPKCVINGAKCDCAKRKINKNRWLHKEYLDKLLEINSNYSPLEEYKGANIRIQHICNICEYKVKLKPSKIIIGNNCSKCIKICNKNTYLRKLSEINSHINLIGEYKGSKTKTLHRCKLCDTDWLAKPNDLSNGVGCTRCYSSKGERIVEEWLELHNIEYIREKVFTTIKPFRYDFYLPRLNICIEYDGVHHFKPVAYFGGESYFEIVKRNDIIKNNYCIDNGIKLIRIPYTKFKNIKNILLHEIN